VVEKFCDLGRVIVHKPLLEEIIHALKKVQKYSSKHLYDTFIALGGRENVF
jgi:hypothetical protein